jgi:probable non-F420 flavinoid oxidoreductase
VRRAEEAGFSSVCTLDRLSPWSSRQGHSGAAWAWLGAALQRTGLPFGVVTEAGFRQHPVVVAQAVATLLDLAPGRLWVALGPGEAANEHVTGERRPDVRDRNERLRQYVEVVRRLLRGEEVSLDDLIRVDQARLWTLPPAVPDLLGVAFTPEAARWCGSWADGLLTVARRGPALARLVEEFREGGGAGRPVRVRLEVAWAPGDDEALSGAYDQWRTNVVDPVLLADLERVDQFERAAAHVRPADIHAHVLVSSDPAVHAARIHELIEAGADEVIVHQVPGDQPGFLDVYGQQVLPQFMDRPPAGR